MRWESEPFLWVLKGRQYLCYWENSVVFVAFFFFRFCRRMLCLLGVRGYLVGVGAAPDVGSMRRGAKRDQLLICSHQSTFEVLCSWTEQRGRDEVPRRTGWCCSPASIDRSVMPRVLVSLSWGISPLKWESPEEREENGKVEQGICRVSSSPFARFGQLVPPALPYFLLESKRWGKRAFTSLSPSCHHVFPPGHGHGTKSLCC